MSVTDGYKQKTMDTIHCHFSAIICTNIHKLKDK